MCLAVPGRIVELMAEESDPGGGPVGTVDFQGSQVDVSLAMVPEAAAGDWVLVHAGFAIALLDEADARQTWEYLQEAGLGEMPAELLASDGRDDGGPSGQAGDGGAETGAHRG